jgi:purine-binding chemotaxis protein CheW
MSITRQFCTFFLDETHFGVPIHQVQEIIRQQTPTRVPLAQSDVCGLINLRGQIITVINLKHRLEMSQTTPKDLSSEDLSSEDLSSEDLSSEDLSSEDLSSEDLSNTVQYNIVIRANDDVISLQIDHLDDILDLSDDDFEPPPATLQGTLRPFLQGAYKLANGFLLVLDPAKVAA